MEYLCALVDTTIKMSEFMRRTMVEGQEREHTVSMFHEGVNEAA